MDFGENLTHRLGEWRRRPGGSRTNFTLPSPTRAERKLHSDWLMAFAYGALVLFLLAQFGIVALFWR